MKKGSIRTLVACLGATVVWVASAPFGLAAGGSENGYLGCGSRYLSAVASGYYAVTATAAGKTNSSYGTTEHSVAVVSGYHSGSWRTSADYYYNAVDSGAYCYG